MKRKYIADRFGARISNFLSYRIMVFIKIHDFRHSWSFHGGHRGPMGTPWGPHGVPWDPWEPMGSHGDPWGPMGTHANPWGHGNPCEPMGPQLAGLSRPGSLDPMARLSRPFSTKLGATIQNQLCDCLPFSPVIFQPLVFIFFLFCIY